ncbi:MAG: DUF4442 domain-containing protein [Acidobacteria bacterium]|nr:DUF4442 domain-containing protein [Acidobacteriota bacterium]
MPESITSRMYRWGFNLFPAYRGTGGRVLYIAGDWREVKIRLPLNWRTRNYVGTTFGGSVYGAIDPFYMLMLIHILGPGYTVWDKAANIRFRRPGKSVLYAAFYLSDEEIEEIRSLADRAASIDRVYNVEFKDIEGVVHAHIEKTLYISKKTNSREKSV